MFRGHVSFFFFSFHRHKVLFFSLLFSFLNRAPLGGSVLFGLKLLLPGLIQVNQSLVVENEQNEVQCICCDADDAEVL